MSQISGKLSVTKKKHQKALKGSEVEKILQRKTINPDVNLMGKAIVQPTGEMIAVSLRGICGRLSRTYSEIKWKKAKSNTDLYLVLKDLEGAVTVLLLTANKINLGKPDEPDFIVTNQISKAWIMNNEVNTSEFIQQLKPLETLTDSPNDSCPGVK